MRCVGSRSSNSKWHMRLPIGDTVSELRQDLRKILHGDQKMANVYCGEEILRKF